MSDTEPDLVFFRQLLLEQQAELMAISDTGDEAAAVVELDQSRVGRLSRMDAMQAQAMSKEAQQRRVIQLQKIRQALQRIEQDEYGLCLSCGDWISEKRLRVDPANPLCIDCAH